MKHEKVKVNVQRDMIVISCDKCSHQYEVNGFMEYIDEHTEEKKHYIYPQIYVDYCPYCGVKVREVKK